MAENLATTITFGNLKGGSGKTTNAAMIGDELARRKKRVLLIDMDPQANASSIYIKTRANRQEALRYELTLMQTIRDGDISQAIVNISDHLDLLPSAFDLMHYSRYMEQMYPGDYLARVKYFSQRMEPLRSSYDYILLDTPPSNALVIESALYSSDFCLIVMQTQDWSLSGARAFLTYMQSVLINQYQAPRLEVLGILPVLFDRGAPVDLATLENARDIFGTSNIMKTRIDGSQRLKRYSMSGITDIDMHDDRMRELYENVVDEMLERITIIQDVKADKR